MYSNVLKNVFWVDFVTNLKYAHLDYDKNGVADMMYEVHEK